MHRESYARNRLLSVALLMLAWSGCADDDNSTSPGLSPGDGMSTGDASAVLTGDAGPGAGAQSGGGATTGGGTGSLGGGMAAAPGGASGGTAGGGGTGAMGGAGTPDGGVSPAPDAGGTTDGGGATTGGAGMTRPDQGMGDGKDVITIGDSWMNLGVDDTSTIGIQASLERASMRDYRNYGIGGTTLLDDNSIPAQYEMAKAQGAIKTVIMTGGGNDVLQDIELGPIGAILGGMPGCIDGVFNDACKKRNDEVAARLKSMWAEMAQDGVLDVVLIAYTNKALGGQYKMTQAYSTQIIAPICSGVPAPLRCSTLDTDMAVPDLTLRDDGIHPDDASYDKIGAAVWAHMQKLGMRR